MPLYGFRCERCGEEFETLAAVGEVPACPACDGHQVVRVFTPFAGPFTVAPRGVAAKRSNAARAAREEQRRERREARRRQG